jgi:hypothetical protein
MNFGKRRTTSAHMRVSSIYARAETMKLSSFARGGKFSCVWMHRFSMTYRGLVQRKTLHLRVRQASQPFDIQESVFSLIPVMRIHHDQCSRLCLTVLDRMTCMQLLEPRANDACQVRENLR